MRALSIRQPYAELILRGIKTIEYRSRPTRIIGERFYIYASKTPGNGQEGNQGLLTRGPRNGRRRRRTGTGTLARTTLTPALSQGERGFPTGVIVGSAVISHCTRVDAPQAGRLCHQWHLTDVRRYKRLRRPKRRPQPVWFVPW